MPFLDLSHILHAPVFTFTLLLFIILFVPVLFRKIRIPAIIGLILSGIVIGGKGLNLLANPDSIKMFSTVGLLYLMFLAGLEIDLHDFQKNRNKSLVFGAATFFVPLIVGLVVCYYILDFSPLASLLIASIMSTHTLLSYPIATKLDIIKTEPLMLAIGGTIITDTAVLLLLSVITAAAKGELDWHFWLRMSLNLTGFLLIVLGILPRLSRWFFRNLRSESGSQYVFVLAVLFLCSLLAEIAGLEAIIGAFFAGLVMSSIIPHHSPLMNRVMFIGDTVFIPFFIIGVGMLVDVHVLFSGFTILYISAVLIAVALFTKFVAAWIVQKTYKYNTVERNVIFGMSSSHAAATFAVLMVGLRLEIINEDILNVGVLLVLVSCIVSSLVTQSEGKKLAIMERERLPQMGDMHERILVPISNPATIQYLIDFALIIRDSKSTEPIYPLTVISSETQAKEIMMNNSRILEKTVKEAAASEVTIRPVSRIDLNVANGIAKAAAEILITKVILGWNGNKNTASYFFGTILDNLLAQTDQTVCVLRQDHPLDLMKRIVVVTPENAELEIGFHKWIVVVKRIYKQFNKNVLFLGTKTTLEKIKEDLKLGKIQVNAEYAEFDNWRNYRIMVNEDDFAIVVSARKSTLSYNNYLEKIPAMLARNYEKSNFVIVYPEQAIDSTENQTDME